MSKNIYRTVQISDAQRALLKMVAEQYDMKPAAFARLALTFVIAQIEQGGLSIKQVLEFNSFAEESVVTERKPTKGISLSFHPNQIEVIDRVQAMIPYFRKEFSMLQRSSIGYVIQQLELGVLDIAELQKMKLYDKEYPTSWLQNRSIMGFGLAYIILYDNILWLYRYCKRHYHCAFSARPIP